MNHQSPKGSRGRWTWFLATAAALLLSSVSILLLLVSQLDFNRLKPLITRIVKEKTGRDLLIHGQIKFDLDLTPSLTVENVAFQNAPWATLPEMASAKQVEVELALFPLVRKKIQVKRLILKNPRFAVEIDRSGKCNLSFQSTDKPAPTGKIEGPDLFLGQVDVEKGVFIYRDGMTGKSFSVTVHGLCARSTNAEDRIDLELRGSYASKPFSLKGWVGPMASLMAREEPWPINVRAKAFGAEMHLSGFVRSFKSPEGLALKIQGAGKSFKGIADAFGVGHIPELGPFRIQCDLSGKHDKTCRLSNLKFSTRAGDGAGELNVTLSGSRPDLQGWLSWKMLDIASLLSKKDASVRAIKIFPSEPIPFGFLEKLTGEVELNVARVILPHTVVEALKTRLHAADCRFVAKPLQFKGGGGEAEGALEVKKKGTVVTVMAQARANRVDLNLLLKERKAQGKAEAEIAVSAQGASIAALMGSLDGHALIAVRGFRVENKYVKLLDSDFITNLSQIFTPASKEANATEINCLVGGFHVANGLAHVTAMVADTNEMIAIGRGRLDLKEERLDLTISSRPKKGVAGLSLSFSELARAFRVGGTFAEPSLSMDPLHTALTIGKAVGGVFLIGPAGAALAFAGQTADEEDVCMAAMEAARQDGRAPEKKTEQKPGSEAHLGTGSAKTSLQSIGDGLGGFFKKFSIGPAAAVDIYGGGP